MAEDAAKNAALSESAFESSFRFSSFIIINYG